MSTQSEQPLAEPKKVEEKVHWHEGVAYLVSCGVDSFEKGCGACCGCLGCAQGPPEEK